MKKKQRRQLNQIKDYFQIGNYIYADTTGKVAIVIAKDEIITHSKIRKDFQTLIEFYGIDIAIYYLKCCSEHLNKMNKK